jgi:hypothetical protein
VGKMVVTSKLVTHRDLSQDIEGPTRNGNEPSTTSGNSTATLPQRTLFYVYCLFLNVDHLRFLLNKDHPATGYYSYDGELNYYADTFCKDN